MSRKSTGKSRAVRRREVAKGDGKLMWIQPLVVGVVVVAAVAGIVLLSRHDAPAAGTSVSAGVLREGSPPPDFTGQAFDGSKLRLSSLHGHVVLLNFFASWCDQCRAELPDIQAAYLAHHGAGFDVVGINTLETGDGHAFYREMGMSFPAVEDPGHPGPIGIAYSVTQSLPASVFINSDGRVDRIYPGRIDRAAIEEEFNKLHV